MVGGEPAGAPAPLTPNLPAEAAATYAEARPRYAKYKETYATGPVGEVLLPGPAPGTYRLSNADAVRRFFDGGTKTPEMVQKLVAAAGKENVEPVAREVLAWQLRRRGVVGFDGMISADKFRTWQRDNAGTLKLFPALEKQFGEAGAAQAAYDETMAAHAAAKKAFQTSAASYFLDRAGIEAKDPAQSVAQAFRDGPQAFRKINGLLKNHPDALEGWQAAVTNYMMDRFRSARPAGENVDFIKSGEFRKFINQNRDSLKAVFGGQGINTLEAVEGELRRSALRAEAGTGSPTTQYLIGAKNEGLMPAASGGNPALLGMLGAYMGEAAAHATTGGSSLPARMAGAATMAIGGKKIAALKQAGIETLNDLVMEALRNPRFAKLALQKVPPATEITPAWQRRIGAALVAGKTVGDAEKGRGDADAAAP